MIGNVWVLNHDKDGTQAPRTFYEDNKLLFQDYNRKGWWVFKSVNNFEATPEEMTALQKKTKRNIPFIKKLNAIFADLDFAKKGDEQTREQKEEKRAKLMEGIASVCLPSVIVHTSNGIQPLWRIKDFDCSTENQAKYRQLIEWVIEWSKQFGWAGDQVKDVTRILRVPWYYHMKAEPYLVTSTINDVEYEFQYLRDIFSKWIPTPELKAKYVSDYVWQVNKSKKFQEVEKLDFQELIVRAFASVWRKCVFDKEGRIILDGRLTGTFQGKTWNRDFLASTSHEPFEWNKITAVADILQVTYKEAFAWICNEYNIQWDKWDTNKIIQYTKQEDDYDTELKFDEFRYTRWTPWLDKQLCKYKQWDFNVIVGESSSWKTEYTYFQARQNAKIGIKTVYFSLEMPVDRLLKRNARKFAGIKQEAVISKDISSHQKELYKRRREELKNVENLLMVWWEDVSLSDIIAGIEKYYLEWYELFYIDNLWYIVQEDDKIIETQYLKALSRTLKNLTNKIPIAINLIHHFRQGSEIERKKRRTIASSRGSGKLENDSDSFAIVYRTLAKEDQITKQQESEVKIFIDKWREWGSFVWTVYFYKWSYIDECPYAWDIIKPF